MKNLTELINSFSNLPGVGKKSANRIIHYLIRNKNVAGNLLISLNEIITNIKFCSICGNYTFFDLCDICSNPQRDKSLLCIVEEQKDLEAIEATNNYKGLYHILEGSINPINGITPDKLKINELEKRLKVEPINEILIATNPTIEGESTFLYLKNLINKYNIKISRLAIGLPMGSSLEYSDKQTLSKALSQKQYL